ncbi:unnamed protein product [Protopolystoma xenopodis]|uniref:Uncharacterized protein n=1 Tax=Protopolystoma xenopodis TaxID=117903 RepID=A0A448X611_9PLAT|nr:unnamed protein product [Protopolystoma xenopodis]
MIRPSRTPVDFTHAKPQAIVCFHKKDVYAKYRAQLRRRIELGDLRLRVDIERHCLRYHRAARLAGEDMDGETGRRQFVPTWDSDNPVLVDEPWRRPGRREAETKTRLSMALVSPLKEDGSFGSVMASSQARQESVETTGPRGMRVGGKL